MQVFLNGVYGVNTPLRALALTWLSGPERFSDFHAYCEVYLGGRWQVFDARFDQPRVGRIRICSGYEAVSCAFTTVYGQAQLSNFEVWSYQVDPGEVSIGDPIDLSKRLCGTLPNSFSHANRRKGVTFGSVVD